ncbi:hypothetical protein QYM36_018797 [Artemia franciscana]|uniref:RNA helicase n=1 Tax=Artemia franciscana TaxID=6661 RepID=A0AA88H1X0_ARTSF|nr:hypothetical protein QYM36_018797 [Artemia franciscana]
MPVPEEVTPSWAEDIEQEEGLPPSTEEIRDGLKIVTEYMRNEDDAKVKVTRTYKIEKRQVPKSIARRKCLPKFGQSKGDKTGPNPATTIVAEEVFMQFITKKEEAEKSSDDVFEKLKSAQMKGIVKCRYCKEDHWTTQCPYKDTLGPLQEKQALTMDNNLINHRAAEDGSVLHENLEGRDMSKDQLRPSFGSQMPIPNYYLNRHKEDVISTLVEEVRHLRQELSSHISKQQALETLMQRVLVELEEKAKKKAKKSKNKKNEAKANIMKLHSEIARSKSGDKMTITSLQSESNIQKNEIAQDRENTSNGGQDYNDPAGVDVEATMETNDKVCDSFDKMGLKTELLRGIYSYGFKRPSPIQQRAILPCVEGNDVIAQAQDGTGKTATFSISILQKIDTSLKECQALVLAPTREVALQIQKVVLSLGDYMGAQCHACIGGTNVHEDLKKLSSPGVHIVVGTLGRVFDMISRRALNTKYIKLFVLDEADQMLSRGFKDKIYDVFRHLSEDIQVILVSATVSEDVLESTKRFVRNPIRILVKKEDSSLEGIKQFYVQVEVEKEEWKLMAIKDFLAINKVVREYDTLSITLAVIFCNTRRKVDYLTERLERDFNVSSMVSFFMYLLHVTMTK